MKLHVSLHAVIDFKKTTVKIKDKDGTNELTVTVGEGNLTYSEKRNIEYILDRGILDDVREGDEEPLDVSLDFNWEYITFLGSAGTLTVEDAVKQVGGATAWVSTDTDACRPYSVDIEITYDPTPSTCGDTEVITLQDFRWESFDHDISAGRISMRGRCNVVVATVSRFANS